MNSFGDMERRYGTPAAYHLLSEIERATALGFRQRTTIDPETRYRRAVLVQDYQFAQVSLRAAA